MNNLNSIILEGNLTDNAKKKNASFPIATFTVAVNRWYKNKDGEGIEEVSFFDCEAFGERMAEVVVENGKKGRGVRVVGRLKQDRWTDEEGKTHSRVYVVCEHIEYKPIFKPVEEKPTVETESNSVEEYCF